MAGPRQTMAGLWGVTAIVACNLAAFTKLTTWGNYDGGSDGLGVHLPLGMLPIASVAIFLHVGIMARLLGERGRPDPFALGFVAATPLALGGYFFVSLLGGLPGRFMILVSPILPAITPSNVGSLYPYLCLGYAAAVSAPKFAVACCAGWYFRSRRITLTLAEANAASGPAVSRPAGPEHSPLLPTSPT